PGSGTAAGGAVMATRTIRDQGGKARPGLTSEQVWQAVARASFAVLSHVTPAGGPPSSGVMDKTTRRRLVVAVAPGSLEAPHVPARRGGRPGRGDRTSAPGGILSLVTPIPPATISFHGTAVVHPAGSPQARSMLDELGSLIPAERRAAACIIEIIPTGAFRTYGLGVSLRAMLNPAAAQARVPVTPDQDTR